MTVIQETVPVHPLDPATAAEIESATDLVKKLFYGIPLHFKAAGLDEPPKKELSAFLQAEHSGSKLPSIPRRIFVMWYIHRTPRLFEAIVDVTNGKIETYKELPRDFHGPVDRAEMNEAAEVVMADPRVKKEIERLQIDDTTVVLDPWDYGVDGNETQERHTQVTFSKLLSFYSRQLIVLVMNRYSCTSATLRTMIQTPATTHFPLTSW